MTATFEEFRNIFIQDCNIPKQYMLTVETALQSAWDKLRVSRGLQPVFSKPTLLDTDNSVSSCKKETETNFTVDSW